MSDTVRINRSPFLGGFGWILVAGLLMVAGAALVGFLADLPQVSSRDMVPTLLRGFGVLAVAGALLAAGLFAAELGIGIRTALVIAGAYFLLTAAGVGSVLRQLF